MPLDIVDNIALLIAGAAVFGVALTFAALVGARRGKATRSVLWTALILWLLVIAVATLGSTVSSHYSGQRGLSLVPFQEIERGLANERGSSAWFNLVGNVALFFPFGVLVACLVRAQFLGRVAAAFVFGAVLSASIEAAQYVLGRVAGIDDIILNASGALLGGIVGAAVAGIVTAASGPRSGSPRM